MVTSLPTAFQVDFPCLPVSSPSGWLRFSLTLCTDAFTLLSFLSFLFPYFVSPGVQDGRTRDTSDGLCCKKRLEPEDRQGLLGPICCSFSLTPPGKLCGAEMQLVLAFEDLTSSMGTDM